MISAEAPIIFAKACEIFVLELTLRSWMQTEENKRRTLQKSDVASAITKTDTFDFLIDIVPREDGKIARRLEWQNDYRMNEAYYYGQPYPSFQVNILHLCRTNREFQEHTVWTMAISQCRTL